MLLDRRRIERLDAQAEMIQVGAASGLFARRGPAFAAGMMSIRRPARAASAIAAAATVQPSTST